ncbi:MAG: hypothetical protein ACLT5P_08245 [Flavonifractor plautii]
MEESIISGAGDRGRLLRPLPHTAALIAHKCLFFAPGARHKSAYSLSCINRRFNMNPKNAHKCMFLMRCLVKYAFFSKTGKMGRKMLNGGWPAFF